MDNIPLHTAGTKTGTCLKSVLNDVTLYMYLPYGELTIFSTSFTFLMFTARPIMVDPAAFKNLDSEMKINKNNRNLRKIAVLISVSSLLQY